MIILQIRGQKLWEDTLWMYLSPGSKDQKEIVRVLWDYLGCMKVLVVMGFPVGPTAEMLPHRMERSPNLMLIKRCSGWRSPLSASTARSG
jgi:hypothetical protein